MTAPTPSLDRFGSELETAAGRDLGRRRKQRRAVRGAALLAVAAAVALGILSALPTGGPSIVQRAQAALQSSGDSILHYQLNAVQENGDGTTASWSDETWQLRVPPYTRRQIATDPNSPRAESLSRGDLNELYDAGNGTIYIATSAQLRAARMPTIEIVSKAELEKLTGSSKVSVAYEVKKGGLQPKVIATKQGAARLRRELLHPQGQTSGELPAEFRAEILALLRSGRVRVVGHVTVDGRDAIRLESLDGKKVYVVDAATYDPIEWTTTGLGGTSVRLDFPVYEELAVDAQSLQLLDLQDQHPGAQVVHDAQAYISAESRLYPHG
jgi:hypothetical protein